MLRARGLLLSALLLLATGCASAPSDRVAADVAPQRVERKDQAISDFERRRDAAQLQAAISQWRAGDGKSCRQLLEKLVERNPRHYEAMRLLADVTLELGDEVAGRKLLEQIVATWPDDPPSHHALGLLLESEGESAEAQAHYRRAIELDPNNGLYQLTAF